MTSHTACSFWVASAAATLRGWHVMGVRIHASAHSACASHSMRSPPCLHSSHLLPLGQGRAGQRKGKVGARQRSCAAHNAMPMLHFAAPGAVCSHFLALSSSYCIWSRLCALLAQLVHHSSRHVQVGTHRNRLGRPGQTKIFPHIGHYDLIHRIDSVQPVTRGAPETSESAGHHFGMLYFKGSIALYSALGQRRPLHIFIQPT